MTGKGKVSKRNKRPYWRTYQTKCKSEGVINLFSDVKAEFSILTQHSWKKYPK